MILGLLSRKINDLPKIIELYSGDILWAWIDAIRNTTLGGLILGFGFLWSDLVCYTIGIIVGAIIDIMINKINIKVISNVER